MQRREFSIATASVATARAQVGLLPGQTRIALRTAAASPKGESASRAYAANFGANAAPAKDGDVVVAGVIVSFLQIDTLTHKNSNRDKHLQNRLSRTRCAFGAD